MKRYTVKLTIATENRFKDSVQELGFTLDRQTSYDCIKKQYVRYTQEDIWNIMGDVEKVRCNCLVDSSNDFEEIAHNLNQYLHSVCHSSTEPFPYGRGIWTHHLPDIYNKERIGYCDLDIQIEYVKNQLGSQKDLSQWHISFVLKKDVEINGTIFAVDAEDAICQYINYHLTDSERNSIKEDTIFHVEKIKKLPICIEEPSKCLN